MNKYIGSIVTTVLFEGITLFMRYFYKLESTRDTASTIGVLTFGIRIHHSYIGLLFLLISIYFLKHHKYYNWFYAISIGLISSDFIHHFLILWPIEGSPEFHLIYPE